MKNSKISGALMLFVGIIITVCGLFLTRHWDMLGYIVVGIGIFIILIAIVKLALACKKQPLDDEPQKEKPEYRRKKTMMSRPEYEFLQLLRGIVNSEKYEVIIQVPLVCVIDKLTQTSYRNELFRVVDFCIVDNVTYSPLLLIELNDASHTRADRIERDRKVNEICESANMPIITFTMQETKDINQIRKSIARAMLKK